MGCAYVNNYRKYFSLRPYIRYTLALFNKYALHYLDTLSKADLDKPLSYPPIFILGAPRSGSTLLFQVLSDAFDVGYLTNRHCQFFGAPALAELIFRPLKNKQPSTFESFHGRIKGPSEPSECGEWWYRFFRKKPAYVTLGDVDPKKMAMFRKSIISLISVINKPILFKNLYAAIRLEAIGRYLPEALFIVINRDIFYNAASILAGRYKTFGCYNNWWSVPPPNFEMLQNLSPVQQVLGQIYGIYDEIDRAVEQGFVKKERMIHISYENLCKNTHGTLKLIEYFLKKHGVHVPYRFRVPDHFPVYRNIKIDTELVEELHQAISK